MILKDEKIKFEKDLIIHLSRLANGSMRDALSLLDQLISAGCQPLSSAAAERIGGYSRQAKGNELADGDCGS